MILTGFVTSTPADLLFHNLVKGIIARAILHLRLRFAFVKSAEWKIVNLRKRLPKHDQRSHINAVWVHIITAMVTGWNQVQQNAPLSYSNKLFILSLVLLNHMEVPFPEIVFTFVIKLTYCKGKRSKECWKVWLIPFPNHKPANMRLHRLNLKDKQQLKLK